MSTEGRKPRVGFEPLDRNAEGPAGIKRAPWPERNVRSLWFLGTRDPTFLFDPLTVFAIVAPAAVGVAGFFLWQQVQIRPAVLLFVVTTVLSVPLVSRGWDLRGRRRQSPPDEVQATSEPQILGPPRVIARTMCRASMVDSSAERFRSGLSHGDLWALLVIGLVILQVLRVVGVPTVNLSLIAAGSLVTVALRRLVDSMCFRFVDGALVAEHWRGAPAARNWSLPLRTARITCDLEVGTLVIEAEGKQAIINLRELWRPHRFVACVISAARCPNGALAPAK